jgi:hypothetical protein
MNIRTVAVFALGCTFGLLAAWEVEAIVIGHRGPVAIYLGPVAIILAVASSVAFRFGRRVLNRQTLQQN